MNHKIPVAVLLAILAPLLLSCHSQTLAATEHARTIQADEIATVVLDANVGQLRLTGADTEMVSIRLRLEPESGFRLLGRSGDPQAVRLETEVVGTELRIALTGDRERLQEQWTVEVPAHVALRMHMNVGEAEISGVAGGCEARLNVGSLHINVPEGDVQAESNVGEVRVRTATGSFGEVEVSASVGDSRIILDGRTLETRRSTGPSSRASLSGDGRDRISLRVNVGEAEVAIR